jgi:cardiolipin synthase
MVLETAVGSGGRLAFDAKRAFKGLVGQVRFFEWPVELRQLETGDAPAAMHAKGAIADEDIVLVTSANLTGSAIDSNMELGLLIRGGPVPRRLARHFRALMADDVLREVK